jgi:hypothetical protein
LSLITGTNFYFYFLNYFAVLWVGLRALLLSALYPPPVLLLLFVFEIGFHAFA